MRAHSLIWLKKRLRRSAGSEGVADGIPDRRSHPCGAGDGGGGHELMHKHGRAVLGEEGWNRLHAAREVQILLSTENELTASRSGQG